MSVTNILFRSLELVLVLYILSFFLLNNIQKRIYIEALKHYSLLLDVYSRYDQYKIINYIIVTSMLFVYPFVANIQGIGGSIVANYLFTLTNKDKGAEFIKKVDSKYTWKKLFIENNIPTPKVIYVSENDVVIYSNNKVIKEQSDKSKFILKPLYGERGYGIETGSLDELLKMNYNNFIIEEFNKDCFIKEGHFRKFRINTLYNGKLMMIKEVKTTNPVVSSSDKLNEISIKLCDNYECNFLSSKEISILKKATMSLSNLHKEKLPYCFTIGWDVMLTCENEEHYLVIEGNNSHGMVGINKKDFYSEMENFITLNKVFV